MSLPEKIYEDNTYTATREMDEWSSDSDTGTIVVLRYKDGREWLNRYFSEKEWPWIEVQLRRNEKTAPRSTEEREAAPKGET